MDGKKYPKYRKTTKKGGWSDACANIQFLRYADDNNKQGYLSYMREQVEPQKSQSAIGGIDVMNSDQPSDPMTAQQFNCQQFNKCGSSQGGSSKHHASGIENKNPFKQHPLNQAISVN